MPLKTGIKSDPPHALPQIEYLDHHQTAPAIAEYMGVSVAELPGVDSMRHFLAGVAATQPSSDDCDLIASEVVKQTSIAPHAGGQRFRNSRGGSSTFI
jgi:hypothetical protein